MTVAFGSYLKSVLIRCMRSTAPARTPPPGGKLAEAYDVTGRCTGTSGLGKTYPIGEAGQRLLTSMARSRTLSQGRLCAPRSGALRDTDTRERESIRRLRCA